MRRTIHDIRDGFTLMEMLLVTGLLAILSALVLPPMIQDIERSRLPDSANQMRSLLRLTRGYAVMDGRRYRVRFLEEGESAEPRDANIVYDPRQPVVEWEPEPLSEPGTFVPVLASWAQSDVLRKGVRCLEIRLGKPTVESLRKNDTERHEMLVEDLLGEADERYPPLYFEPDGSTEWATFVLTSAPPSAGERADEIDPLEYPVIEVILDGVSGLAWLQRPLQDEELDMLEENNWPPVFRRDFLNERVLTENDVIEIQESLVRKR
jgi:prepilin-type N-terminal cleavage/methylation domain-containing protein